MLVKYQVPFFSRRTSIVPDTAENLGSSREAGIKTCAQFAGTTVKSGFGNVFLEEKCHG